MPPLTRWFIKSSLIYLVAALVTGMTLALRAPLHLTSAINSLMPVYLHLFMVGWVAQFIFGVVYWMFPEYSKEKPRGSQALAWATYGLLNVGLIVRAVGEPLQALRPEAGFGWLLALSAVLQWLGGMVFVVNSWARVK
jgi:hypothetical protein